MAMSIVMGSFWNLPNVGLLAQLSPELAEIFLVQYSTEGLPVQALLEHIDVGLQLLTLPLLLGLQEASPIRTTSE